MNALPDPLPAGAIHNLQPVSYENLDANKYYYLRRQIPAGGPPEYEDLIVYTNPVLPQHWGNWKNDERVIVESYYKRDYKRIFDLARLEELEVVVPGNVAQQFGGQAIDITTYLQEMAGVPGRLAAWRRLPYAMHDGQYEYDPWYEDDTFEEINKVWINIHPELFERAYTFYEPLQAGGRRRRTLCSRRRSTRRRSTRRRSTRR
jgi:hypothetical protein